jgi:hypothetical protein
MLMGASDPTRAAFRIVSLGMGLMMAAMPSGVLAAPQAQLVHCGDDTCLRISGHRSHSAVAVRVAGRDLAVQGARNWRSTVPLEVAREWMSTADDTLTLTMTDMRTGAETAQAVSLPPGALGKRIELATLIVRAY